jgi:hypothetical protein
MSIDDKVVIGLITDLQDAQLQTMRTMLATSEAYQELRTAWRKVDDVQTVLTDYLDNQPIYDTDAADTAAMVRQMSAQ